MNIPYRDFPLWWIYPSHLVSVAQKSKYDFFRLFLKKMIAIEFRSSDLVYFIKLYLVTAKVLASCYILNNLLIYVFFNQKLVLLRLIIPVLLWYFPSSIFNSWYIIIYILQLNLVHWKQVWWFCDCERNE